MEKGTGKRWGFVAVVGALLFSGLGNGVWEMVMQPAFRWFGEGIFAVATLGISSLRDAIYQDVANGSPDRASMMALSVVTGFFLGMVLVFVLEMNRRFKKVGARIRAQEDPSAENPDVENDAPKVPKLKLYTGWGRALMSFIMLAPASVVALQVFQTNYILRAVAHAEQLQRMLAPYVSTKQRLVFASRLASVRTREDYEEIIGEMRAKLEAEGITPPDFSIL